MSFSLTSPSIAEIIQFFKEELDKIPPQRCERHGFIITFNAQHDHLKAAIYVCSLYYSLKKNLKSLRVQIHFVTLYIRSKLWRVEIKLKNIGTTILKRHQYPSMYPEQWQWLFSASIFHLSLKHCQFDFPKWKSCFIWTNKVFCKGNHCEDSVVKYLASIKSTFIF